VLTTEQLVRAIGPALFRPVVIPARATEVRDVFLTEPGDDSVGGAGDLVLGLCEAADAPALVERCAATGASGLVLRRPIAEAVATRDAAEQCGLLLAALQERVTWAHVVWLLHGVLERAAAPDSPIAGDAGVYNDLFVLADAVAGMVNAPVTIEDDRSRVLAYSSGQDATDQARVATIVGRKVPPDVVAHLRARGVFRRLARSSKPFLVPEGPDGTLPRLVVPVRAGQEWLGSIWAVVDGPVPDEITEELSNAASVLALHLLRYRAQADVARGQAVDRLRSALSGASPRAAGSPALPPAPWRVVALFAPRTEAADPAQQRELWTTTCRRHSWANPLLADVDDVVFAVVTEGTDPGSWTWLQQRVLSAPGMDASVRAAASALVHEVADLPTARAQAVETLLVVPDDGRALAFEDAWAALTLGRAISGLAGSPPCGPVATLREHDDQRGTAYVETLGAWLSYPGHPQVAARALHVHPNTLRYRMNRLQQVVDLDLTDPRQRLAMQLQVEAARAVTR
jgi:hypothetical protein